MALDRPDELEEEEEEEEEEDDDDDDDWEEVEVVVEEEEEERENGGKKVRPAEIAQGSDKERKQGTRMEASLGRRRTIESESALEGE